MKDVRWVVGSILIAVFALFKFTACRASTLEECVYPRPIFDKDALDSPAVAVVGQPGSKAPIHPVHPSLCSLGDSALCGGKAYVIPGDRVRLARRCGGWVYAEYSGKQRRTAGWVDVMQVSGPLPPDRLIVSQGEVAVTEAPMCTHHWLWATHDGRFASSSGQSIAVHARNPQLCTEPDAGLCGKITLVKPGKTTYYSEPCGAWVYVSPRDNESAAATGWVAAGAVVPSSPQVQISKPTPTDWPYEHDALYKAVMADDKDQVRKIVASGRNLNVPIDAGLPASFGPYSFLILTAAIKQGKVDMVSLLLSLGADPNARDPDPGISCLLAAAAENPGIANAMIHAGADVNCGTRGWPLKWAAGNLRPVDVGFLRTLIAAHADVNIDGGAPLKQAIDRNNVEGAELLLAAGAKANPVADPYLGAGQVPMFLAISNYEAHWDPTMTIVLLNSGADPNYVYPDLPDSRPDDSAVVRSIGQSPLTFAAEKGYFEVVRILLQHGADPQRSRPDGQLPAALAEKRGYWEVAALIENYARSTLSDTHIN